MSRAPASILVDSGASVSFASVQWCRRHRIVPTPMHSSGRLADPTAFHIVGKLSHCSPKLLGFRLNFQLLVADLPGLDVVLGLDFLKTYDPIPRGRQ